MNCDFFYEVEKKYNLFEKEYNGFEFWVYMRRPITWKMQKLIDNIGEAHYTKKTNRFENILLLLKQFKYVFKNGKVPKRKYDILFVAHSRRVYNGEKYECIYTDILAEQFQNSITIEKPYQGMHYEPAKSKEIIYMDIVDIKIQLYSIYKSLLCKKEIKQLKHFFETQISEAVRELNQHYKTEISVENLTMELVYMYYSYRILSKYFEKVLKRTNPSTIVEVVSYSMEWQVLNEVAYDMNIPTVELQHGIINKNHVAYNYPEGKMIKQFPQNIFLFSDYWKEGVQYPISKEHILATGNPHLERQEKKYKGFKEKLDGRKRILFLSSGPIGTLLANTAVELYSLLPDTDYEIIYKLHPGEFSVWEEKYPQLVNSQIKVISNNKTDLYQLFCEDDILISGFNSTTIFEGMYYGLQAYVSDYRLIDEIRNLEKKNLVKVFKTTEELYNMIVTQKTESREDTILWKKDAFNNVMRELKEIMEKN